MMRQQIRQYIVPVFIPGTDWWMRIAAHHNFECRVRRGRREKLVRIYVEVRRMVDGQQSHPVEVDSFFERFHEAKTQKTSVGLRTSDLGRTVLAEVRGLRSDVRAANLDELDRPRDVALPRPDPVSHHARSQHICDKFVAFSIPHK